MVDARAAQHGCTPAEWAGLDIRSPDPVQAWSAAVVNEACYLAGGRREANAYDSFLHNKGLLFHVRELPMRR